MTVVLMNSVVIYGDIDIKMDNSIFRTILNNFLLFFLTLLAYFVFDIEENIFSSSFISECKPWDSLGFVERAFKRERDYVKDLTCIHLYLWCQTFPHSCAYVNSLVFEKKPGFSLIINNIFYLDH